LVLADASKADITGANGDVLTLTGGVFPNTIGLDLKLSYDPLGTTPVGDVTITNAVTIHVVQDFSGTSSPTTITAAPGFAGQAPGFMAALRDGSAAGKAYVLTPGKAYNLNITNWESGDRTHHTLLDSDPTNPESDVVVWKAQAATSYNGAAVATDAAPGLNPTVKLDGSVAAMGTALKLVPSIKVVNYKNNPANQPVNENGEFYVVSNGWEPSADVRADLVVTLATKAYDLDDDQFITVQASKFAAATKTLITDSSALSWTGHEDYVKDNVKFAAVTGTGAGYADNKWDGAAAKGVFTPASGKLELLGTDWHSGDKIYFTATVSYDGVDVVADQKPYVEVVQAFSDTTPVTFDTATLTGAKSGDGLSDATRWIVTPSKASLAIGSVTWHSGDKDNTSIGAGTEYAWAVKDGSSAAATDLSVATAGPSTTALNPGALTFTPASGIFPLGKYTLNLTIDKEGAHAPGTTNSRGALYLESNGWGSELDTTFAVADAKTAGAKFSVTGMGTQEIEIDVDVTGDITVTTVGPSAWAADGTGALTIPADGFNTNLSASDADGSAGTVSDGGAFVFDPTDSKLKCTSFGDFVPGGTIVFDIDFTYDGVKVTVPEAMEIDVEA